MLFRVMHEALLNSIKHASANHINIQIRNIDTDFEFTIEDDGCGFDIESAKQTTKGLQVMKHRMQLLDGTIEWKPNAEKGIAVIITIPIEKINCN